MQEWAQFASKQQLHDSHSLLGAREHKSLRLYKVLPWPHSPFSAYLELTFADKIYTNECSFPALTMNASKHW